MINFCTATTNELIREKIRNIIAKENIEIFEITDEENWLDSSEVFRLIDELFWLLPFKPTTKGAAYYKFAVYFAYFDNSLLFDNKKLVEIIAKYSSEDAKNIRALLDSTLNPMNKPSIQEYLTNFFHLDYEIGKLTVKNFIALLVNKLNIATNRKSINMFDFM